MSQEHEPKAVVCNLADQKCVPCEGGVPKLGEEEIAELLRNVEGWTAKDDRLHKRFVFPDFVSAMSFLERVAVLAEAEGHHPDFCVHYNKVDFTIYTHAIDGLSNNDFILAAKIDKVEK